MSDHPIFPDKPAFVPSPGRIVLVRYLDNEVWPAMVLKVDGWDRVLLSVHTDNSDNPLHIEWFPQRKDEDGYGWYRPGDWPQPTV